MCSPVNEMSTINRSSRARSRMKRSRSSDSGFSVPSLFMSCGPVNRHGQMRTPSKPRLLRKCRSAVMFPAPIAPKNEMKVRNLGTPSTANLSP